MLSGNFTDVKYLFNLVFQNMSIRLGHFNLTGHRQKLFPVASSDPLILLKYRSLNHTPRNMFNTHTQISVYSDEWPSVPNGAWLPYNGSSWPKLFLYLRSYSSMINENESAVSLVETRRFKPGYYVSSTSRPRPLSVITHE